MSARTLGAGVALACLLVGATACVPASPDDDTYEGKASTTLGGAVSEVATMQKILGALHEGRIFRQTAIAQMRDSQSSLDTNTGAFNEVHPPRDLDWLYRRSNALLSDAADTGNQARLAIERYEAYRYPAIARELGSIADRLGRLEGKVS